MLKRLFLLVVLLCLLTMPSYALSMVTADYDSDEWEVQPLFTEPVEGIPEGWVPLRKVSEYLPLDVSWDEINREVVVYTHVPPWKPSLRTFRYQADNMPEDFIIKDGVTYCHPRMVEFYLWDRSFFYGGELYFIDPNSPDSQLIQDRESEIFEIKVLTALWEIRLKLPEEYAFIREHLSGGILYMPKEEVPAHLSNAIAYISPSSERPVCKIVGDEYAQSVMVMAIAHEAHHVWEYHNGGVDEAAAYVYGSWVSGRVRAIKK